MRLFAYGSNLAAAELSTHRFLGTARLEDHRLEFRRRSVRWGGGAADIVSARGEVVWGALYELPDAAVRELDAKEGQGFAYRRRPVRVRQGERTWGAVAYEVIDKEPHEVAPTAEYLALVVRPARERGLPEEYVVAIERHGGGLLASGRA